jgi:5S rRNA maturation endonuclease (ribonuclease M5)
VAIVESEMDCERLEREFLLDVQNQTVVPTTMGGANYWEDKFANDLTGKRVIIIPDNDDAGRRCRDEIVVSLGKRKIEHTVIDFQPFNVKDVSKFLDAYSCNELKKLIGADWVTQPTRGDELLETAVLGEHVITVF